MRSSSGLLPLPKPTEASIPPLLSHSHNLQKLGKADQLTPEHLCRPPVHHSVRVPAPHLPTPGRIGRISRIGRIGRIFSSRRDLAHVHCAVQCGCYIIYHMIKEFRAMMPEDKAFSVMSVTSSSRSYDVIITFRNFQGGSCIELFRY